MMLSGLNRLSACVAALLIVAIGSAAAADAPGCRDPDGLGRFQGAALVMCVNKDFAEYVLPTGAVQSVDFDKSLVKFEQQVSLEGRLTQNVYALPPGVSSAQAFRNYSQVMQARGYAVLYQGKQSELGDNFGKYFEWVGPGTQLLGYSPGEARYLAASRDADGRKVYAALYVIEYEDGYDHDFEAVKGQVLIRLDTLEAGPLDNRMGAVTPASEIDQRLQSEGRVALYGVHFDFNSALLRQDSWPAIDQIAAYLSAHPDRGLSIVGHTDNIGGPEFNMQLSRARAAAVVEALVNRYGVVPARLVSSGAGLEQPVASNDTDEGRAMNRRVELLPR